MQNNFLHHSKTSRLCWQFYACWTYMNTWELDDTATDAYLKRENKTCTQAGIHASHKCFLWNLHRCDCIMSQYHIPGGSSGSIQSLHRWTVAVLHRTLKITHQMHGRTDSMVATATADRYMDSWPNIRKKPLLDLLNLKFVLWRPKLRMTETEPS